MTDQTAIITADATPAATAAVFDRAQLSAAMTFVAKSIIEGRNSIPILSAIVIEPGPDGGAIVYGTDLDMAARMPVACVWDAPAPIVIADARGAAAAIASMAGDDVRMTVEGERVRIASSRAATTFATMPIDEMPRMTALGDATELGFDAALLAHDLARVALCISTEETRYYLNGIVFTVSQAGEDGPCTLRMAATDGHRLAVVRRPIAVDAAALAPAILPRKLIACVRKLLGKKAAGHVALAVGKSQVRVTLPGGAVLESKLIDGTFPDVERVIPNSAGAPRLTFDAPGLAAATKRITKGASEKTRAVKIEASADGARLSMTSAEGRSGSEEVPCDYDANGGDDTFCAGFNADYLAALAGTFGKSSFTLSAADASAPTLLTSADAPEFLAVLMPMRIDGGSTAKAQPAPAAAPAEPVLSPDELFTRDYGAAYAQRDAHGMRAAIGALWEVLDDTGGLHDQIALRAARIRRATCAIGQRQHAREMVRERRASQRMASAARTSAAWQRTGDGFGRWSQRQAHYAGIRATYAAQLAALDGYSADDTREVLPVMLDDGKRIFVPAAALADTRDGMVPVVKASGERVIRRRSYLMINRTALTRVIPARGARVARQPAPAVAEASSSDVAALAATVAALIERIGDLEATVASQAADLATVNAAPAAASAPLVHDTALDAAECPADAESAKGAYIAALVAERDAMRKRAEAAEERAEVAEMAFDMIRVDTARFIASRTRTAARLRQARGAAAEARWNVDAMRGQLMPLRAELDRLRPLVAAVQAFVGQPVAAAVAPVAHEVAA